MPHKYDCGRTHSLPSLPAGRTPNVRRFKDILPLCRPCWGYRFLPHSREVPQILRFPQEDQAPIPPGAQGPSIDREHVGHPSRRINMGGVRAGC